MTAAASAIRTSRGFAVEFEAGDHLIGPTVERTGSWEEPVAEAIERYLEPGWTFLDLGAGVGYFSLIAAQRGNSVLAVEPHPEAARLLAANVQSNAVRGTVALIQCAVHYREGYGQLVQPHDYTGNPGARVLEMDGLSDGEAVDVRRLVDLLGEARPEFIKLDIEGLEQAVIEDSGAIFEAARVVVVEVSAGHLARYGGTVQGLVGALTAHGFDVRYMNGNPLDEQLEQLDADPYAYMNLLALKEAPKAVRPAPVLLCAWRNLVVETAECMLQLRDRGWGYSIARGDALISRSRSRIVSSWYRHTDEDVFLMIDDDVVFKPTDAEKVVELARQTRSVVCAAYPVKDGGHLACRRQPGQEIAFGPKAEPVEIIYPATGFMAVHRDVIKAMVEAQEADGSHRFPLCDALGLSPMWAFFQPFVMAHDDGSFEYLSEDYAFGEQARRLGFKVWLDPSVILMHLGMHPYHVHEMKGVKPLEDAS